MEQDRDIRLLSLTGIGKSKVFNCGTRNEVEV
jgi:hypothetical protein